MLTFDRSGKNGPTVSADRVGIYLDTNAFITAFETVGDDARAVKELLRESADGRVRLYTSELTLAELLVVPQRTGNLAVLRVYEDTLMKSGLIRLVPITRPILLDSVRYRTAVDRDGVPGVDRRNFLPDAIHVVTAVGEGCAVFLTHDRRIRLPGTIARVAPNAPEITQLLTETP